MCVQPITVFVNLAVLANDFLHSLLHWFVVVFGCQRKNASPVAEKLVANATVELQALRYGHSQARQHY
jgi:hypothetical protein